MPWKNESYPARSDEDASSDEDESPPRQAIDREVDLNFTESDEDESDEDGGGNGDGAVGTDEEDNEDGPGGPGTDEEDNEDELGGAGTDGEGDQGSRSRRAVSNGQEQLSSGAGNSGEGSVSRRTRLADVRKSISELPADEVARLRSRQVEDRMQGEDMRMRAYKTQQAEIQRRGALPYTGKKIVAPDVYVCPRCNYPNHYDGDACNKLTCGKCSRNFCIRCLRPAEDACPHLYGEDDDDSGGPATQSNKRQKAAGGSSSATRWGSRSGDVVAEAGPESGIIRCIKMENFKNHANLELHFGPHVNFIQGDNGSGKSAILAAIIVALGGNPNKNSGTAKGAKAASGLVREGASTATVELVLANGGVDRFKIESGETPADLVLSWRANLMSGGGVKQEFKINGVRTTQKQVEVVREHFNLQVENPCVILTQAVAAGFLRESKDSDKRYRFFLEAASLDTQRLSLSQTREELEQMKARLGRFAETLSPLQAEVEEAKRVLDSADRRERLESELAAAEATELWAVVAEAERQEQKQSTELQAARASMQSAEDAVMNAEEEHAGARARIEAGQQCRAEQMERLRACLQEEKRLREQSKELKQSLKHGYARIIDQESQLAEQLDHRDRLRRDIEKNNASSLQSSQHEGMLLERTTAAAQRQVDEQHACHTAARRAEHESSVELETACSRADDAAAAADSAACRLREAQDEARRMQRACGSMYAVFDRAMDELVKRVANTKWPSGQTPVGPLGAHISLAASHVRFEAALERMLGNWVGLSQFVVASSADEQELRSILRSPDFVRLRGILIRQQPPEPRFRPQRPNSTSDQITAYDVLSFSCDAVHNAVLNICSPEKVLLCDSMDAVRRLVFASNARFKMCFTPDAMKHFKRGAGTTGSESTSRYILSLVPTALTVFLPLSPAVSSPAQPTCATSDVRRPA